MSKNNNYRNYNSYSSNNNVKAEEPTVTNKEMEPLTNEVEQVEVTEIVQSENSTPVTGIVTNCSKLRVRKTPNANADNVICEIDANSEVIIDETKSTNEFYKVCTGAGFEGFCMKRFITVQ
jgi:ribulose 1,5-bisphosphate synthetase/thiazole synthase